MHQFPHIAINTNHKPSCSSSSPAAASGGPCDEVCVAQQQQTAPCSCVCTRTHTSRQPHLAGSKIIVLVSDNQASKLAFKLGKALLQPRDELQLVTVVLGEESVPYGSGLLAPYLLSAQQQQQQQHGPTICPVVRCADQQHARQQDQHKHQQLLTAVLSCTCRCC